MGYTIQRSATFNNLCALVILFPVFFSFVFAMIGIPVPSYLAIIVIFTIIGTLLVNRLFTFSADWLKIVMALLFLWILGSISYTNSVIASKEKFISIVYNTVLPIFMIELFFLSSEKKQINLLDLEKKFLLYSYCLIWFAFFAFLLFRVRDETGRYSIPGLNNPIWFSRFIGMLMIVLLYCEKPTNKNVVLYFSSILIALFLMFAGGSRGPLLAVIITYCFIKSYLVSKKKIILILTLIVLLILIGFKFVGGYLFETNFYSLSERVNLVGLFSSLKFDYLKGNGIGSYSISFFGKDVVQYPHNVFLELFIENGIIGVLIFIVVMGIFFKKFQPNIITFLCFFYFLSSLPSGDIPGNNNLYILLYLSIYARGNTLIYYHGSRGSEPPQLLAA
ncbi:hypothetical protein [Chitinophaga solisilvae]|uniref:hypothetical protein n=1 Tax=Chitinophaga solisilvae TaxID=1233460 RepID=UPI00137219C2|nr:hypothetical protein [Chitinophaga solisilvae]